MRSFRIFFCALLLAGLAGAFSEAAAQRCAWGQHIPSFSNGGEWTPHSATDAAGNTFVLGLFQGQLSIGGFTVTSHGPNDADVYIAKYDATGALRWLKSAGAPQPAGIFFPADNPAAITTDPHGDVFITGMGWHNFYIGGLSMDSCGNYLAKLDGATGAPLWLRRLENRQRFRGSALDSGSAFHPLLLATDAAGNCYMGGAVWNLDTLGNLPLPGGRPRGVDYLVAKCDGAGQFQWATQVFGNNDAIFHGGINSIFAPNSLNVDAQGAVTFSGMLTGGPYAFGSLTSPITITGTDTLVGSISFDAFVARLAPNGAPMWVKQGHGTTPGGAVTYDVFSNQVIDASGNTYLTGRCDSAGFWFDGVQCLSRGDYFMMKLNPQGALTWARSDNLGGVFVAPEDMCLDPAGQPLVTGFYTYSGQRIGAFGLPTAVSGANVWLAGYTAQGDVRWVRTASEPVQQSALGYSINTDAEGNIYVMGIQTRVNARAVYDGQVIAGPGPFVLRFDNAAQVSGHVYLDRNANNQRDPGEIGFPRSVLVSDTGRPHAASSSSTTGRFTVFADTGRYHVTIAQVPRYHTFTQGAAGYAGHLMRYGQTDTARTFGFAPIANQTDVRVTLTPFGNARRGFANRYRARIENLGTVAAGGVLTVQFDGLMLYSGAATPPTAHTTTSATWAYANLAPFEVRNFDVAATTPITAPLDTLLHSRATVMVAGGPDLDLTNNLDAVTQRVTGSYDPNDLTVNYTTLTPAQVATGTLLDYVVRFQNMGTDTAFTVVITDTLPAHLLRLGTLDLVGASHNCWYNVLTNNELVIHFDNINLPANSTSILNSMGFVRFQVKPRATLVPGALIPNTAHIVFDYNAPLATNEVSTLVQTPNGLVAAPATTAGSLYPNPATATDFVTLTADIPITGSATVRVLDALGRPVREQVLTVPAGALHYPLDVRGLASGLYVVRLTAANGISTSQRLVIGERR